MKKSKYALLSIVFIIGIIAVLANFFELDITHGYTEVSNSAFAANTCTASGSGELYTVNKTGVNVRRSASSSATIARTISKNTKVIVYCQVNGFGKITTASAGSSSDEYINMNDLTIAKASISVGNISKEPSTFYNNKNFTGKVALTLENIIEGEEDRVSIDIVNSSNGNANSYFNITRGSRDGDSINVTFSNKDTTSLPAGTYNIVFKLDDVEKVRKSFVVEKKEFYFDLDVEGPESVFENEQGTWVYTLNNIEPSTLTIHDFNVTIKKGTTDNSKYFDIEYKDGKIIIKNKERTIGFIGGFWNDKNNSYASKGTYTVSISLINKSDYASDRVDNHTKTSTIKITSKKGVVSEITTERAISRYRIEYQHLDYDIDIVSTYNQSGIKRFVVNENNEDGTFTQVTYSESQMKEIYPNIDLSAIYTEKRNGNKVAVDFGNSIYIIKYINNEVTFYSNKSNTPIVLADEDFEAEYPTAHEKLHSNLYKFDENGNILYHQTGNGTKIKKVIKLMPSQAPQSITGGEIKIKLQFSGFIQNELNDFRASLIKEEGNMRLIENAGELVYDSNFEMVVDKESEFDKGIVYITIKYLSDRDEYMGKYNIKYGFGNLNYSSTFELLDGKTDYTLYSEVDPGNNTSDPLSGQYPNANKKYDYNIGFYMKKTKVDYDKVELDSLGYQIFDKRVDYDKSGNYVFFEEIEYITRVKKIADGKVYFDLSTNNGATYTNNQILTIDEFKNTYSEAFEYFSDYAENKTKLKYYNLDEEGNIISDNYALHPVRMYALTANATDMTLDYLDNEGTKHTVLMNDAFKRANSSIYRLISTRFGYDGTGKYILGAIRGRRRVTEDKEGNAIVGHEVTDQFYVKINRNSSSVANSSSKGDEAEANKYGSASKTLTILPKTEVNAGVYYIYITQGGSQAIGYLYTDNSEDAAIDIAIYPELWNRNIHMTSMTYANPSYNVTINDPIQSNSKGSSIAYANVESYLDFDLTLDYIYDLTGLTYKVQYKDNNNKWIDVPDYFDINAQLWETKEITDETYESKGLTKSTLKLTTKAGQTKKGTYRLVFNYSHNGTKMPTVTKEFTIKNNFYGISINPDEIEKKSFYSNYADTIYIPIHTYTVEHPENIEFALEYIDENTEEIWEKSTRQFKNYKNSSKVIFNYNYKIEKISDGEAIYLLEFKNYQGNSKPQADEGSYMLTARYQEDDGEVAQASFGFKVNEPKRNFIVTKDTATARENEMFITRSLMSEYVVGSRLVGNEISYTIEMYDKSIRKYVDVSSPDADLRLFEISTKWEDTDINDKINYNGKMKINLDVNKIDEIFEASDNNQFQLIVTLANVRYPIEMPNLRELFKWEIEDVKITGSIDYEGEKIEVDGYYNNANPKLDIKLKTIHEEDAKFLITNVCTTAELCTPNEDMINFNSRFDIISKKADEIILKVKENLPATHVLEKGKYQVVVYYSATDFDIYDFIVRNEYLGIEFGEASIETKLKDGYSNELFTNKDSTISIPVKVIGAPYENVTVEISNDENNTNYNHMFNIDYDKFINNHILEIKYDSNKKVDPNDYLIMVSKDNEGEIVEDHKVVKFNSTYYNYNVTNVTYSPNPAVPNYENGGEIVFDITTDELMTADVLVDNEYRNMFVNNLRVFNSNNVDVTNEFEISYKTDSNISDLKVVLRYSAGNNLAPGEYKAVFSVTKEAYTLQKQAKFVMGDFERRLTITEVLTESLTRDELIHRNVGGKYIVNYTSNYEMHTEDLYVRISDKEGKDVTDKFVINKDDAYHVDVKFDPELFTIDYGVYTITLTYADPITHNDNVNKTDVIMYGDYKEITIKDITSNTYPILAESENQYYNFSLDTDNLTEEEQKNMIVRIYDDADNIVYSDLATDGVDNIFEVIKNEDATYKVNILPYKARVGIYYVSLILPEAFGLYNISNRLALTIDDTLYKVNLLPTSNVVSSEKINDKYDIYDYIGVDGTLDFHTTSPIENEYSIKIFNNLALVKEIPVNENNIDDYKQILFTADEISNGEVEFALCIKGLPYASITESVLEYIKITELAVILDNRDVFDEVTLDPGDEKEFELYIRPENATNKNLIFTSSNSDVATFLGNKVIVHDSGTTEVTVKNKEVSKTFTITASAKVESSIYEVDQDKKTIFVGSLNKTSLPTQEFISNLLHLNSNYKIYNGSNEDVTSSAEVIGTNYKLVSGNSTYTVILIGDVNGSGTIDMGDVTYLNRINNGYITANEIIYKAARVLKQEDVNNGDVTKLYRFFLGRIDEI